MFPSGAPPLRNPIVRNFGRLLRPRRERPRCWSAASNVMTSRRLMCPTPNGQIRTKGKSGGSPSPRDWCVSGVTRRGE